MASSSRLAALLSAPLLAAGLAAAQPERLPFLGASDASAAVALGPRRILVADDESNVLRLYDLDVAHLPIGLYDLTPFLRVDPEHPEADIEGATRVGDRIYWIASHGRNKDGKPRPSRHRFFATDIQKGEAEDPIRQVGHPYSLLLRALVKDGRYGSLGLEKAARLDATDLEKEERRRLAPKDRGVNIEGLSVAPDGRSLLIGFRNPRPYWGSDRWGKERRRHALVAVLTNPSGVVEKQEPPKFADPILLDLGGRGVRSIEYRDESKACFIVAGPHDGEDDFALYRWSGRRGEEAETVGPLRVEGQAFNPEALVFLPDERRMLLLSDDGTQIVPIDSPNECLPGSWRKDGTCLNKHLVDDKKKRFLGLWLEP